jgi:hypothetical protein
MWIYQNGHSTEYKPWACIPINTVVLPSLKVGNYGAKVRILHFWLVQRSHRLAAGALDFLQSPFVPVILSHVMQPSNITWCTCVSKHPVFVLIYSSIHLPCQKKNSKSRVIGACARLYAHLKLEEARLSWPRWKEHMLFVLGCIEQCRPLHGAFW